VVIVGWCPLNLRTGIYEISAIRRKKSTVENYINNAGLVHSVVVPLYAKGDQE
jgi:hypothetical protein